MCIESSGNETAGKPHTHLIHSGQLSVSDNNFIMLQQNIRLSGATVVVTGAAGFIGASLTRRLLDFVKVPQEELVRAVEFPKDYDF